MERREITLLEKICDYLLLEEIHRQMLSLCHTLLPKIKRQFFVQFQWRFHRNLQKKDLPSEFSLDLFKGNSYFTGSLVLATLLDIDIDHNCNWNDGDIDVFISQQENLFCSDIMLEHFRSLFGKDREVVKAKTLPFITSQPLRNFLKLMDESEDYKCDIHPPLLGPAADPELIKLYELKLEEQIEKYKNCRISVWKRSETQTFHTKVLDIICQESTEEFTHETLAKEFDLACCACAYNEKYLYTPNLKEIFDNRTTNGKNLKKWRVEKYKFRGFKVNGWHG